MNFLEFCLCTSVKPLPEPLSGLIRARLQEKVEEIRARTSRGRLGNYWDLFCEGHPLESTHAVHLRSKLNPFILAGNKPPPAPVIPRPHNMALSSWKKTADTFGAYYLMLFRQFDIEDLHDMFFDWDDFCSFIAYIDPPEHVEELRSRRSFVSRSRCRLITNIAHGLKSNETDRFMLQVWRNYMRTLWTDENMPRSEDVGQKPAERTIFSDKRIGGT